jgi:hypothetical protein
MRKSCLTSDTPPVNGSATRFFRNALRRSSFASIVSTSACLAAITAPIYFTKLIPHFSHLTPVRCLLPQEGHSKRIVMWQRWQKRATSRTAAPHFGQGIVACGTDAAVGFHAFAELAGLCSAGLVGAAAGRALEPAAKGLSAVVLSSGCTALGATFARTVMSDAASSRLPPPSPEDEPLVIAHLNGMPVRSAHRIAPCIRQVTLSGGTGTSKSSRHWRQDGRARETTRAGLQCADLGDARSEEFDADAVRAGGGNFERINDSTCFQTR